MDTPALPRRPLPIGIQTFAKLREQDCYYMDKTGIEFSRAARNLVGFEFETCG